jgi:ATP-dependent exoDNAse (exonuclease V) beta subunit
MIQEKPLRVLSASAGSGKTFSLVQSYLKLTLSSDGDAIKFSKILAMTFTNKAAWEMKERIIEALDLLAYHASDENSSQYIKAKDLLAKTAENLQLDKSIVIARAGFLLSLVLHNYEDFSVMTIDKFNLRLIRTFARELNLNEDFEVVISTDEYIAQVVEEIMSQIGRDEQGEMTQLAVNYAKTNFDEGDRWDFKTNLIEFAKLLSKEVNYHYVDQIKTMRFEKEDFQSLIGQIKKLKQQFEKARDELNDLFLSFSIGEEELPFKSSGIFGFYDKLPEYTIATIKEPGVRILATLSGNNLKDNHRFPDELSHATAAFFDFQVKIAQEYYLLNTLRKNFHNIAFLKYIAETIDQLRERDGVLLISEFNKLISKLLLQESAPFIYERIGTRFEHYLLDEFQDTSRLQLINLIPLLHDSIGNNYSNLIVGDPKQAIYRFRNGLVEQFVELPSIYNPENDTEIARISSYFANMGDKESLTFNWRSRKNIVTFNNIFFKAFKDYLSPYFASFYDDVGQIPKGKDGGYVRFDFWDKNQEENKDFESEYLYAKISELKQEGYNYGDICILARRKAEAAKWADYLVNHDKPIMVVSADSLKVDADVSVELFIHYLKLRRNPRLRSAQMQFAVSYLRLIDQDELQVHTAFIDENLQTFSIDLFLTNYFESKAHFFFAFENMYDLGQKFLRMLDLNELENPYLSALMGVLLEYDLRYGPDLRSFLEFWEKEGHNKAIQVPGNDDAVKIMTAHTAKGLEFPVVILPSLTWDFTTNMSKQHAFYEVENELLYTSFSNSAFAPEIIQESTELERNRRLLDDTNLLYVAFTRPVDRLYCLLDTYAGKKKAPQEFSQINNFVHHLLEHKKSELAPSKADDTGVDFGEIGEIKRAKSPQRNLFFPKPLKDFLWFPEIAFMDEEGQAVDGIDKERRFGQQLHLLLAKIGRVDQKDAVISELLKKDNLEKAFLPELQAAVDKVLSIPEYRNWLATADEDMAEQAIISTEETTKRPDRLFRTGESLVIVDFKSGKATEKDKRQLISYRNLLDELGFKTISGYLLYTNTGDLERLF